ncbi:MAG: hypothetical protein R3B72_50925 [Polyangiaceae bacterium]
MSEPYRAAALARAAHTRVIRETIADLEAALTQSRTRPQTNRLRRALREQRRRLAELVPPPPPPRRRRWPLLALATLAALALAHLLHASRPPTPNIHPGSDFDPSAIDGADTVPRVELIGAAEAATTR